VVFDQLLLVSFAHSSKSIERALEVSFKGLACLHYLGHHVVALLFRDTGSKRVTVEIATNTDTGGYDHGGLIFGERRCFECTGIHIRNMVVSRAVLMVMLNDGVKELIERFVRVVGTSVAANT